MSVTFGARRAAAHDQPPAGLQARTDLSHVAAPTLSTTTSACTGQRSAAESIAADRAHRQRLLALGRAAAGGHDLGAEWRAMASAAHDTPEPMPTTSTVWPAATRARRSIR